MKKLVIILTIAIMLFSTQEYHTEEPASTVAGVSQNVTTEQMEKVRETHSEQAEKTTEADCEPMQIESIVETEKQPMVHETPMKECAEELEVQKAAEQEETVKCVDEGDQTLAEYKPQPSGQVNPFENAPPAEIVDNPVEDLIGEGEDRPGEGKHF